MRIYVFILLALMVVLTGCSHKEPEHAAADTYTCPMHPQIVSDRPGICPICQMDLVKKSQNEQPMEQTMTDQIRLTNNAELVANVQTTTVHSQEITLQRQAYGYLDIAESRRRQISARFSGRIERLHIDRTGLVVGKGQPLFEVYSPEMVQAQNDYLIAAQKSAAIDPAGELGVTAKTRLELLGFTDAQIQQLQETGRPAVTTVFHAPFGGTVLSKSIVEGQYIREGDELYDLADLSSLWFLADFSETDSRLLNKGAAVTMRLTAWPEVQWRGVIDFVSPVIDPQSRTVRVRAVFANNQGRLKPQMYGTLTLSQNLGRGLTVPQTAVLFTGKRSVVWIKKDNSYHARVVQVGVKMDNEYQVLEGVQEGEEIVVSGGYLVDSESQLQNIHLEPASGAAMTGHQHGQGMGGAHTPWNEVCPVMDGKVNPKSETVEYQGKYYGFCCPECIEPFKADPARYAARLSEDGKKIVKP